MCCKERGGCETLHVCWREQNSVSCQRLERSSGTAARELQSTRPSHYRGHLLGDSCCTASRPDPRSLSTKLRLHDTWSNTITQEPARLPHCQEKGWLAIGAGRRRGSFCVGRQSALLASLRWRHRGSLKAAPMAWRPSHRQVRSSRTATATLRVEQG